jgi:hypothetical protein
MGRHFSGLLLVLDVSAVPQDLLEDRALLLGLRGISERSAQCCSAGEHGGDRNGGGTEIEA